MSILPPDKELRLRPLLELIRLPNVFTVWADVIMGFLVTHAVLSWRDAVPLVLLVGTSTSLYWAGMVLNDLCDLRRDWFERPERPLPSGRISVSLAKRLVWRCFGLGLLLSLVASHAGAWAAQRPLEWGSLLPTAVALVLTACIVAYDAWFKQGPLGPVTMGACRSLNILLGMSTAVGTKNAGHAWIALTIGVYIAGITWFARSEAGKSRRVTLAAAGGVLLGGAALLLLIPRVAWIAGEAAPIFERFTPAPYYLALAVILALLALGVGRAVADPSPSKVQALVKYGIMTLILFDAALVWLVHGPLALAVLALLVPALLLGRWAYST